MIIYDYIICPYFATKDQPEITLTRNMSQLNAPVSHFQKKQAVEKQQIVKIKLTSI